MKSWRVRLKKRDEKRFSYSATLFLSPSGQRVGPTVQQDEPLVILTPL